MRSFNRVLLLGHLAADPELKQTESGISVSNFPLATNRMTKGENGEKKEVADFHRVIAWNGLATICKSNLVKGDAVLVEGRILNHSFDDKEGNRHFRTEISADNINILTWKKNKSGKGEISVKEFADAPAEAVAA